MVHDIWNWLNTGIWSNLAASAILGLWARWHFNRIHTHLHRQDAKVSKMHKDIKEEVVNE